MEMTGWGMFRNCVVTATLAALVVAGCGGTKRTSPQSSVPKPPAQRCAAGTRSLAGSTTVAWAANVQRPTTAFRAPGGPAIQRFGVVNVNKAATVFGVLGERVDAGCRVTWLHVSLPIRPNGATGWVRAANVLRTRVHTRITVDLSERRVRLYRDGRLVLTAPAAIGSSATPTPLGRYYVNQRLIPDDPSGPYGPGAVGISAFSPVLTGWTQGGPIAIHGTNEPWSIGRSVSNGCIRIPNALLKKLFRLAVEGTPVLIRR
jgi:lipoprotein-anchoring transpeptidase ErfK/SrfK